jgi:UDP-glucose 4-epimerase
MVLGGLGYIGSHTTLELLKDGYNVVVVDDLSNCFAEVLNPIRILAEEHCREHGVIMPTLRFHKMDYRSAEMRELFPMYAAARSCITGVIHFAAFKSVAESIERPLAYYQNNICGLVDLLVTLQENGIKNFVFSSSATVYGAKANEGKPLREDDLVHFDETYVDEMGQECLRINGSKGLTCPYGRSKYFAEAILADLAKADPSMRITALRYFNPVGCHPSGILREDPRQKPTNLFPVIASVMKGTKATLEVFGSDWDTRDGTAIRDFIHVMDLAQGHVAALAAAKANPTRDPFRAYNLGTGRGMTVSEVITSFEKASKQTVPAILAPRRAGDVGACVAATQRAETELGWQTEKGVDECARDTWKALNMPVDC